MSATKLITLCILAVAVLGAQADPSVLGVRGRSLLNIAACSDLKKCVTTTCSAAGAVVLTLNFACIKSSGTISNIRLSDGSICLFTGDLVSGSVTLNDVGCGKTLTLAAHDGSFNGIPGCITGAPPTPAGCPQLPRDNGCRFCEVTINTPACATTCTPSDTCHNSAPQGCACVETPKTCSVTITADKTLACPGEIVTFTASSTDCASSPVSIQVVGDSANTITGTGTVTLSYTVPQNTGCKTEIQAIASVCSNTATATFTVGASTALTLTANTTSACPNAPIGLTAAGGCGPYVISPQNADGTFTLGSGCGSNTFTVTDFCGSIKDTTITATDSVSVQCDANSCAPIFTSTCTGLFTNPEPTSVQNSCTITRTYTVSDLCGVNYPEAIVYSGTCPALPPVGAPAPTPTPTPSM